MAVTEVWLSPEQVAERTGKSIQVLRKWREKGTGPAYRKVGTAKNSDVRYPEHMLQEWMQSQTLVMPAGQAA
jgi:hypothetical protein